MGKYVFFSAFPIVLSAFWFSSKIYDSLILPRWNIVLMLSCFEG